MTPKIGIRGRFVFALVLFSLALTSTLATVLFFLQAPFIESFYRDSLLSEMDYFQNKYELDPTIQPFGSQYTKSYLDTVNLPARYRDLIKDRPDGVYFEDDEKNEIISQVKLSHGRPPGDRFSHRKIKYDVTKEKAMFVGIRTMKDGRRLYLLAEMGFIRNYLHKLAHAFLTVIIAFCILGVGLALVLARRVTLPLTKLASVIKSAGIDTLPTGFSKSFKNDEFGTLARALDQSMDRVRSLLDRERQFTRDASHELRSPVTVIKGALEILDKVKSFEGDLPEELLRRVERSVIDMEITIESLLWLARETPSTEESEICQVLTCVENAVERNRHHIADKPIELTIVANANPELRLPSGVFLIAVSNLIRNAIQFTTEGQISITLNTDHLAVKDPGIGIAPEKLDAIKKPGVKAQESPGFGFGLDIVNRLCQRFEWRLDIDSAPDHGTTVKLFFRDSE